MPSESTSPERGAGHSIKSALHLHYICQYFNILYDDSALKYWLHEHHSIGGNFVPAYKLKTQGEQAMIVRDLRPSVFPNELVDLYHAHPRAQDVYAELLERSQECLRTVA
jgi:hypothetical protein